MHGEPIGGVIKGLLPMRKDAQTRIRLRIRARLDELGMTARELARAVRQDATDDREKDAWISGILAGRQGVHLKHLDAIADKLALSPSELVRYDDAQLRELTPREMRLLRHYQDWPGDMQDRWLAMLDYFTAQVPDVQTAALLDRLRVLPRSVRRPVLDWFYRLLEEGPQLEVLEAVDHDAQGAAPNAPTRPRLSLQKKPLSGRLRKAAESPK